MQLRVRNVLKAVSVALQLPVLVPCARSFLLEIEPLIRRVLFSLEAVNRVVVNQTAHCALQVSSVVLSILLLIRMM